MQKDYTQIKESIFNQVDMIFKELNLNPVSFFLVPDEKNKICNEAIINTLAPVLDNKDTAFMLTTLLEAHMHRIAHACNNEDIDYKDTREFNLCRLIKTYIVDFNNQFFKIEDGKAVITNVEHFELPSMGDTVDLIKNKEYLRKKIGIKHTQNNALVQLLIGPKGDTFYAPVDHMSLARWLTANGVSLKDTIRVQASKMFGEFNFTSLYNYQFSTESSNQQFIRISDEQSQVLGALYGTLLKDWVFVRPLDKELRKTTGFGIGKNEVFDNDGLSGKNLKTLSYYMSDYFSVAEYRREASLSNDVHTNLS